MRWELAPEQSTGCLPVDQGLESLRHPMLPGDVVQADRLWHRQRREIPKSARNPNAVMKWAWDEAHEEPSDKERQADRPEESDSRPLADHLEALIGGSRGVASW